MPKTIKKSAICEKCKVRQNINFVYYCHVFLGANYYTKCLYFFSSRPCVSFGVDYLSQNAAVVDYKRRTLSLSRIKFEPTCDYADKKYKDSKNGNVGQYSNDYEVYENAG